MSTDPQEMVFLALEIFGNIIKYAMPFSVVFAIGNIIVDTFLRVAFGGELRFGRGR